MRIVLVLLPLAVVGVLAAIGLVSRDETAEPTVKPEVRLVQIGRFDQPVHLTSPPGDDRLFVVERKGRIWVIDRGRRLRRPFLDMTARVATRHVEEGLLSLAFAPDYATSGLFYVDYTNLAGHSVVEELRRSPDPNVADASSGRRVLLVTNPPTLIHRGGHLLFGPDGRLYISQGDGGIFDDPEHPSQRLDNLHGKVLRIDPRRQARRPYSIPRDNPFVGRPGRDEIWVYGLRNPWRIGFDPASRHLVIGDVGQLRVEEIDVAPRPGLNFGWPCLEGNQPYDPDTASETPTACEGLTPPALELQRASAATVEPAGVAPVVTRGRARARVRFTDRTPICSVVLGPAVGDPVLPGLAGRHLYGDFCDAPLRGFRLENGQVVDDRPLGVDVLTLSSFGVDARGRVYATSFLGPVYRLEAP